MNEEMDSLVRNQNWDLVELHVGKRELQNKCVYRLKEEEGGNKPLEEFWGLKWAS